MRFDVYIRQGDSLVWLGTTTSNDGAKRQWGIYGPLYRSGGERID